MTDAAPVVPTTTTAQVLDTIRGGLNLIERITPTLAALGIPGAKIAGVVAEIAEVAVDRIEDGTLAASSEDRAELDGILAKLRALNDAEDAEALAS